MHIVAKNCAIPLGTEMIPTYEKIAYAPKAASESDIKAFQSSFLFAISCFGLTIAIKDITITEVFDMNIQDISVTSMAKLGISCLENAVLMTLIDADSQGQRSLNASEICESLDINEGHGSDRIIFSILDDLANKQIVVDLVHAKWQIRKKEESQ